VQSNEELQQGAAAAHGWRRPDVCMDSTGGFVVVWEDDQAGTGLSRIVARRFNPAGETLGALFTVNQASPGQHRPAPASAGSRQRSVEVVVIWQGDRDRNGSYEILARPYRSDGSARADEIPLNSIRSGQRRRPDVGVTG
jgi:hypothetical protein